ncbi:hypothetical protein MNBD_ALPHA12-1528 [hydrothermal vent metagenome]|uniref:Uncharacterized protein n=1 Tax=hydrothermal vent metagenome TaxID=652676 RepID=A0A3B0TX30_9ZZZZ
MKNLTLWGAAFLGIFIFSMTMFSQAMSNTGQIAMVGDPARQNISPIIVSGSNLPINTPASTSGASSNNMLSGLLRIGEKSYNVDIAPSVSRKVISQYRVRKFSFGRLENVQIITTASGTYSSDALKSHHIVYPGINVSEVAPFELAKTFTLMIWQSPGGWKEIKSSTAPSFLSIK